MTKTGRTEAQAHQDGLKQKGDPAIATALSANVGSFSDERASALGVTDTTTAQIASIGIAAHQGDARTNGRVTREQNIRKEQDGKATKARTNVAKEAHGTNIRESALEALLIEKGIITEGAVGELAKETLAAKRAAKKSHAATVAGERDLAEAALAR